MRGPRIPALVRARVPAARGRLIPAAVLACVVGALSAPPAVALSTDRDQPIDIWADKAEADDAKRVTIYRGNVIIVQGSLRIEGDTVWIHYDDNDDLTKLVSEGRQAHFRQLPDGEKDFRTAYANRLEYYKGNDLIVMLGDAKYGQGPDRINAERIVYDSRLARMKADAGAPPASAREAETPAKENPGRVRIRIVPKKKPPDAGTQ